MKNVFFLMLVVLFLSVWVLGCGTMHGAGQDLESAGQSIQAAAK